MNRRILIALATAIVAICPFAAEAQPTQTRTHEGYTTEGREFWVVFQKNFRDFVTDAQTQAQKPAEQLHIELFITSSKTAHGTIDIRGIGFHKNFDVQANRVINIPIDTAAQLRSSERVEDLAVHIVSDEPIAVYGLNRRYQTTDTYLAYPVNVLGTSYRVMGYRWLESDLLSQFAIIATKDSTRIRITPTVETQKRRQAGIPFEITLNTGEVYQVIPRYNPATESDLTGSLVEADQPVAVFSGHNCAYVPDLRTKACNHLVEQIPPLNSWGRQFFVGTLAERSSSALRVLAQKDSTHVFENNRLVATLGAGEFYENKNQTLHTMVTADEPVLVCQFSKGFDNGDNVGDPMMIAVAPTEQFLSSYRFATPVQGSWHHYINVIVPTSTIGQLVLDGRPVDPAPFKTFGLSRYSIGQIKVNYGTHVISGPEPFGLYSYGFGYDDAAYDAYGNGGGQSMEKVIQLPDTVAPDLSAVLKRLPAGTGVKAVVRDDRVNDQGIDDISLIDDDNVAVTIPGFEKGTPQVEIAIRIPEPRQNAYARFRLRDKAGNVSTRTICAKYMELGDSIHLTVLTGSQSCDFSRDASFGAVLKYSVLENDVSIPAGADQTGTPVTLRGNGGVPTWGFALYGEMPYSQRLYLTGRLGFDILHADVIGYFPDSMQNSASDGQKIAEEFKLHHNSLMMTMSPGIAYYFSERKAYLFGLMNISFPLHSSETLTKTIQFPSNYLYDGRDRTRTLYDGSDPSSFSILFTPEIGIGASVDIRRGLRIFGELGGGYSLTTLSADRSWYIHYLFARLGAKMKI